MVCADVDDSFMRLFSSRQRYPDVIIRLSRSIPFDAHSWLQASCSGSSRFSIDSIMWSFDSASGVLSIPHATATEERMHSSRVKCFFLYCFLFTGQTYPRHNGSLQIYAYIHTCQIHYCPCRVLFWMIWLSNTYFGRLVGGQLLIIWA